MGDIAMEAIGGMQVSLSAVIEGIEREMFDRAKKETVVIVNGGRTMRFA